jgi:hypothetical protein
MYLSRLTESYLKPFKQIEMVLSKPAENTRRVCGIPCGGEAAGSAAGGRMMGKAEPDNPRKHGAKCAFAHPASRKN